MNKFLGIPTLNSVLNSEIKITENYGIVALAVDTEKEHAQILLETLEGEGARQRSRLQKIHITFDGGCINGSFSWMYNVSGKANYHHDENCSTQIVGRPLECLYFRVSKSEILKVIRNAEKSRDRGIDFAARGGAGYSFSNQEQEQKYNCYTWAVKILQDSGIAIEENPNFSFYNSIIRTFGIIPSQEIDNEMKGKNIKIIQTVQSRQNSQETCVKITNWLISITGFLLWHGGKFAIKGTISVGKLIYNHGFGYARNNHHTPPALPPLPTSQL